MANLRLTNFHIAVISKHRWKNVPQMLNLLKVGNIHWYVGNGEGAFYAANGAQNIVETAGLSNARNKALVDAFYRDKVCIQLSDDMVRIKTPVTSKFAKEISFIDALKIMWNNIGDAKLAGIPPTDNPMNFRKEKPVRSKAFIIGDFMMIKPNVLRFDTNLKLKEDYDYTIQHVNRYGQVARCDEVLAEFRHRTNAGGAVDIRNESTEQKAIEYLKSKWPENITDNHKRQNEILLRFT